jgi:hypothetical protein
MVIEHGMFRVGARDLFTLFCCFFCRFFLKRLENSARVEHARVGDDMNIIKNLDRQILQSNRRLNATAAAKSEEFAKSLDGFND